MSTSSKPNVHYVILRDDDTNALTCPEWLEQLYRPFLDRNLPVNLATIPMVRTDVIGTDGRTEGYLIGKKGRTELLSPIGSNERLVSYLLANPGYRIVQHGYDHSLYEFDSAEAGDVNYRLEKGARLLVEAGFPKPKTFVAPYDRLSRESLREVSQRFAVLSTGWFEARRLPLPWLPAYAWKKLRHHPHWRADDTVLLTHPGCLLSYHRPCAHMLEQIKEAVAGRHLTVLVTHWWEYFRDGKPDDAFIAVLHQTALWLANQTDVKVVSFDDLVEDGIPLN